MSRKRSSSFLQTIGLRKEKTKEEGLEQIFPEDQTEDIQELENILMDLTRKLAKLKGEPVGGKKGSPIVARVVSNRKKKKKINVLSNSSSLSRRRR